MSFTRETSPNRPENTVEAPTPGNNVLLQQMAGMRRDMHEVMERNGRSIDLMNRLALRMDEGFAQITVEFARIKRDINTLSGDMVLMENRVLTAIEEVRRLAARLDDNETGTLVLSGE